MIRVLHGDMFQILPTMAAESVHAVVCDPPYHLTSIVKRFGKEGSAPALSASQRRFAKTGGGDRRPGSDQYGRLSRGFMGQQWDGGDIAMRPETWAEVYRVMKPGAHLVAFGGSRTSHRMACAIEDAGFEIRDTLLWLYSTGFPKSHSVSKAIDKIAGAKRPVLGKSQWSQPAKSGHHGGLTGDHIQDADGRFVPEVTGPATPEAAAWEGWGTALKPAYEPIILARKPLIGAVAANVLVHGCGALNIDACRIDSGDEPVARMEYFETGSVRGYGGGLKGGVVAEPNLIGRWPANVLHDGSDDVIAAFPDAPGQLADVYPDSGDGRKTDGILGSFATNSDSRPRGDSGSAARFFKACPFDQADFTGPRFHYMGKARKADRAGSKHPTVKPLALMSWLVALVTPPGGTVLDPFAGTGTTLLAADRLRFNAIGIEKSGEYIADIHRRLHDDAGLFADITNSAEDKPP